MGGGMRQAGYLAAAGIYALDHHIGDLKKDNDRAKSIGGLLQQCSWVESVKPVQTNIVIFTLSDVHTVSDFLGQLTQIGINAAPFGPRDIRFVFHRDLTDDHLTQLKDRLLSL